MFKPCTCKYTLWKPATVKDIIWWICIMCGGRMVPHSKGGKMKYLVRRSFVDVVGNIWMPCVTCSLRIDLSAHDIDNMRDREGDFTRESIGRWLDTNAGDFSSIQDWSASIEDGQETLDFPFKTEEGELAYYDTLPSD